MQNRSLCIGLLLIITGCVFQQVIPADNSTAPIAAVIKKTVTPLVIVGEGGPSGSLFEYAANTYVKEHGGIKYTVHDGDAFIDAMQEFRKKHGPIESFVYFGHGNEIGLYVNQELHVNGGLYASDPILHAKFRAASLYELPQTVFATGSTALFYGCNVARNEVGLDSFAEQFANHFQTQVKAATGPTEFSFEEDTRMQKRMPAKIADASLYMLPTFSDKGFVTIDPSPTGVGGYNDVYKSMEAADALSFFSKRGLRLGSESLFYPFQSINANDAKAFCTMIDANAACDTTALADPATGLVRNTSALKLLLDASRLPVKKGKSPFEGEIYFASQNNLLTHDFIHKRWYSRADMAMLTWNILQLKEQTSRQ